jgi:hypothetical protein
MVLVGLNNNNKPNKIMKTTAQLYKQFLVSSQINYTCTYLSEHLEGLDENSIYRFLQNHRFRPRLVWEKTREVIKLSKNGYIIFDDTVLDKNFSFKIEGSRKQYSGDKHKVIKGIGVVTCLYYNPELDKYWILDFRIFDPERDGKSKVDHLHDMIESILKRNIPFKIALMDSWYATTKTMLWLDSLGKVFYCPIKSNRLVDDTEGKESYRQVGLLEWNSEELKQGKLIKVKKFPKSKKVKLFRVIVSNNKTEYVITNNLTQDSTDSCQKETAIRWNIEQFHRETKQNTGIEKCQCRINRHQRNHICLGVQVWIFLAEIASKTKTTIYQIKKGLLDDYMTQQLRNPSLVYC